MKKDCIAGIKLSPDLMAVRMKIFPEVMDSLRRVLRIISEHEFNLYYLSTTDRMETTEALFCVDCQHQTPVRKLIENETELKSVVEYIGPVVVLSLFNHQFNLGLAGRMMTILHGHHIPIYGSASSLSSLSYVIDSDRIKDALAAIRSQAAISDDRIYDKAARRQTDVMALKEICSSYQEAIIKTYGFIGRERLALLELQCSPQRFVAFCESMNQDDRDDIRFEMILAYVKDDQILCADILLEQKTLDVQKNIFAQQIQGDEAEAFAIRTPVELLYLFGPHFGDRPGIARAIFDRLKQRDIEVVVSGLSGASVYLVLNEGMSSRAKNALGEVFSAP